MSIVEKTVRCTHCAAEFTDAELEGASSCPKCGTSGVPCLIAEDVTIKINWHELRILGIWADNWANRSDIPGDSRKVIAAILERLQRQHPDKTPLTLAGEVRQLQEEYPGATMYRDGEVIVPPKKVQ